ncbi:MAG TPA: NPCBM/NEW2 domain-containing protein [Planctomycetaceae bacterium]|nr:NPCBM/NEW2 domain-containing protein [Planctomycetaceae bacterium]
MQFSNPDWRRRPAGRSRGAGFFVHRLLGAIAVLLPLATPGFPQENPNRLVSVRTQEGREFTGNLVSVGDGQLTVGTTESHRLPTRNLISLRCLKRPSVQSPTDPLVLLSDGGFLAARVISADELSLVVRWARFPAWDPLKLPLEGVRAIIFNRSEDAATEARLWNRLAEHRARHDLVLLTNGDSLFGQISRMDEQVVTLDTAAGQSSIERAGIRAVAFNPELINVEPLKEEGALVSLVDGSRFRITKLRTGTLDRLVGRTLFAGRFELPLLTVESLRFLGGCATWLSDIEPSQYKFEPFLDYHWPWRRDRNVQGGRLALRGAEYPKGLGLHSRCEISYRLDGAYRTFQATVGIDDDTQGKGSALFEVLVDGKSAYKSGDLTGSVAAVTLERIDLTGAKTLTLRVDFGAMADVQDHADWCDAVLVK